MSDAEEDYDNSDIEVDEDADGSDGYQSEDSSGHNTSSEVEIGDAIKSDDDKYVDSNDNDSQTIEVDD